MALLWSVGLCGGFYLPGVAPKQYADGEKVEVKVNKLTSTVTQLPYDYYNLAFCKPNDLRNSVENLGEVLHGSMIQNSPYELFMQKPDFKVLCKVDLEKTQVDNFAKRIKNDYRVQMIMDNLPAATRMVSELPGGSTVTMYDRGYRCASDRLRPTCLHLMASSTWRLCLRAYMCMHRIALIPFSLIQNLFRLSAPLIGSSSHDSSPAG